MSSNTSCTSQSALPAGDIDGLPRDINVIYIPSAHNKSRDAMTTCCAPNNVGVADSCIYWCELLDKYPEGQGFAHCLSENGVGNGGIGGRMKSAAGLTNTPELFGLAVGVLLIAKILRL
ncbi:hypothetical protein MCOR02_011989 [Pyricularia oryzae]|uniref:Uncharacterized protein n=1 Tax=Pyricularia oryzae TaxID=318829 RepID=A0A4P7NE91_PYROR|nr:hypothetical protein MCOR02_011989 [Pyricularia oryzae]KAI6305512.1 hypothetical protein MCOR34_008532 [Pyricularia oryzae]KAI6473486.1 hypothetical protein MCOR17_002590 [Pyricularia oryzae]KAI6481999.1 hypothetical protein MCOR13_010650 [Pyricularia oryzae]KAI6552576.1 hypothetical protein MCOR04_010871 [Pyricularia oryzae]